MTAVDLRLILKGKSPAVPALAQIDAQADSL